MVRAILQDNRLLGFDFLAILLLLSHLHEPVLLGLSCLRHVLLAQLQHVCRLVLVNGAVELIDRWWDFEAHQHDLLSPLQAHVLWPLDEARQITLGLDVATKTEATRRLLEKGVLLHLFFCSVPKVLWATSL